MTSHPSPNLNPMILSAGRRRDKHLPTDCGTDRCKAMSQTRKRQTANIKEHSSCNKCCLFSQNQLNIFCLNTYKRIGNEDKIPEKKKQCITIKNKEHCDIFYAHPCMTGHNPCKRDHASHS